MTGLIGSDTLWLFLFGSGSLLLASMGFILAISRQRRRFDFLLKDVQTGLQSRVDQLEEELALSRQEQTNHWSEIRKAIARLEFRGGGASERIKRPSMVGLDKKHQVCSLARQGLAAEEISRKLNLYPGETELVLGLTKFTEKNNARPSLQ